MVRRIAITAVVVVAAVVLSLVVYKAVSTTDGYRTEITSVTLGENDRELVLSFTMAACESVGKVVVEETPTEVGLAVFVRASDECDGLAMPEPHEVRVHLESALGSRTIVRSGGGGIVPLVP